MDADEIYVEADERMLKSVDSTRAEFLHLRAGRANPALLDRVMVEAYGTKSPLNQRATGRKSASIRSTSG